MPGVYIDSRLAAVPKAPTPGSTSASACKALVGSDSMLTVAPSFSKALASECRLPVP